MAAKKNAPKTTETTGDSADGDAAPVRNLTRESVEQFLTTRLQEPKPLGEGLSPEDAAEKAQKRALEMCPD